MKLIAMINSRSNPQAAFREITVEAENYSAAYQKVLEGLGEDDQLLSVR